MTTEVFVEETMARDATLDVEITPVSWTPRRRLSWDEWAGAGITLQEIKRSLNWWLGDWIIYGQDNFGESYAQAIELYGHELEALKKYVWVARNVPKQNRRPELSWTHHMHVGSESWDDQRVYLEYAVEHDLRSAELNRLRPYLKYAIHNDLTPTEVRQHLEEGRIGQSTKQEPIQEEWEEGLESPTNMSNAGSVQESGSPFAGNQRPAAESQVGDEYDGALRPFHDQLIDSAVGSLKDTISLPKDPVQAAHKLIEEVDQAWLSQFLHEVVTLIK